jgi:hypothetical protein
MGLEPAISGVTDREDDDDEGQLMAAEAPFNAGL